MLLALDIGNSHVVAGLFDGPDLRAHWRMGTSEHRTADEWRVALRALLDLDGYDPAAVSSSVVASVVPSQDYPVRRACKVSFGHEPHFVCAQSLGGITYEIDNPSELGADRAANIAAARARCTGPFIVVDFGTATTFDAVTHDNIFAGGAIVPGLQIAADALFERCAKLPHVDLAVPAGVIGRDTVSNIQSGLMFGYADLIDGLTRRMSAELEGRCGQSPAVFATGGLAPLVAKVAQRLERIEPFLTLEGLRIIHEESGGS